MLYSPVKRVFYIHIPRTGGTSVTEALKTACGPELCIVKGGADKHLPAFRWRHRFWANEDWQQNFLFTIVRDPWNLIASKWRFCRHVAATDLPKPNWRASVPREFVKKLQRCEDYTFPEFVKHEFLGRYSCLRPGGFWRTYCLNWNGEDLGVQAYRYEDLETAWQDVCQRIGAEHIPLPRESLAPGDEPEWPADLARTIGEFC